VERNSKRISDEFGRRLEPGLDDKLNLGRSKALISSLSLTAWIDEFQAPVGEKERREGRQVILPPALILVQLLRDASSLAHFSTHSL
jgi:hypothetical protein